MIGRALKKLAKASEMTISGGYAYGSFRGYDAVFFEGSGYKTIVIMGFRPEDSRCAELTGMLESMNLTKEYRIREFTEEEDGFVFKFNDNPGTMKKINAFIDWFMPMLPEYGMLGSEYCPICGREISQFEEWRMLNGMPARAHASCLEHRLQRMKDEEEMVWQEQEEDTSLSYGRGAIGAILGALIGTVIWAIIYMIGYVTSLGGLLILFLAYKGYTLFKGKRGKAAVLILLLVTVAGVILGNVLGVCGEIGIMLANGEFVGLGVSDLFFVMRILFNDAEFVSEFTKNLLTGFFYAFLGCLVLFVDLWTHNNKKKFSLKNMK